jgi:chemotaxis protein histidine kinase CheA
MFVAMSIRDDIPPYLKKAADLFFEEIGPHLNAIESLANDNIDGKISAASREEIAKRFHTLRGGAGFLKIEALHAAATAGEKESSADGVSTARVLELTKTIREVLSKGL